MNGTLQSVLHPAGADAAVISQFAWILFGAATVIFVAVMALMALSLRDNARPLRPGLWIAGAGVAFPVLVLSALLTWSTWRSAQLVPQGSQAALSISVTARMWWWEVRYRDPAGGREIVTANEIHIPVGQAVYVGLNAADVIHSLWVPSLSGKRDMIPGRVTGLTLRADRPGVYRGQCAEFCGAQHANMALHVVALAPDAFRDWLRRQALPARAPQGALLERGRAAFLEQRCQTCHTIRGVAETARLGPDLTHVGSRAHIGAGLLQTHQNTLAGWIADPQAVKPGVFMPAAAGTDGDTLGALAAYLEHLQ
ncbi:cytochrome C oxidase subunit II [Massilia sp. Root133]|uniref:C-type cytochrome n=1 Tax=Massilia cellulosiltytica TaxID=2683234 RepID=A0A7X3K551_9BURK|nr:MULTISPECIES: c-type cytochrome [Telluria group]KQY12866.1 cytochrome C oxidase subunit II [Massilia sp. Root133]KQZ40596.1 cytochrome C oxidase subunit II [Massilia sp. Root1485]MVW58504.1 c-type cytochrome [Telluria cellulosilytica]